MPSSLASRRAMAKASSLATVMISSIDADVQDVRARSRRRCPGSGAGRAGRPTAPGWPRARPRPFEAGRRGLSTWPHAGDACRRCRRRRRSTSTSPVGVVPDLLGRGRAVDLGIGRVVELLRHDRTRDSSASISSALAMAPFMPFSRGVRTSSAPRKRSILRRSIDIAFGHGEDQPVAARGGRRRPGRCRYCRRSARPGSCPGWSLPSASSASIMRRRCGP